MTFTPSNREKFQAATTATEAQVHTSNWSNRDWSQGEIFEIF